MIMDFVNEKIFVASLSVIGALLTAFITSRFRPRAVIQYSVKHAFSFFIKRETGGFIIHTKSILIMNTGKGSAKDIEVIFAYPPEQCKIWPPCDYEMVENAEKFFIIKVRRMTKKSNVSIEILHSIGDPPNVVAVTHEDGKGREIALNIQPMYTKPVFITVLSLMFLGVVMAFYFVINTIMYLRSFSI
jgi:hypothetical protein